VLNETGLFILKIKNMKTLFVLLSAVLCFSSSLFAQWTVIQHSGLPDSQNPTLAFSAVDSNVCWGFQGAVVYPVFNPKCILTTDGGAHWNPVQLPVIPGVTLQTLYAIDRNTAWITMDDPAGTSGGGIFKTTNGGNDWIKQGTAFPGAGGHPLSIYFFDASYGLCTGQPRNGYCEIYTTADGGATWIRVPSANIPALVSDDYVGWGTGAGNSFWFQTASCSVFRTTDKGLTWSVYRTVFPAPAYFTEVAFKDTLNGLALSYFGDEINKASRTTDGGVSWTRIPAPPSPPSGVCPTYIPGTSGSYFNTSHKNIGYPEPTVPGSAYTPDAGLTWIHVDDLAHGPAAFVSNKIGWSSGCGDTIFKWHGISLGIGDESTHNQVYNTVTLGQNYPNPVISSTSIEYHIPGSAHVILKVYDLPGSNVATLVNEEKSAGSYVVKFEPGGLRAGFYFYSLQVGKTVLTKKLCIL
jgi:photosystem II stability/assembly factor-like uncharacterized protein